VVVGASNQVRWAGAVVGRELYNVTCPVVTADPAAYAALSDGDEVTVAATDEHATVRIDVHRSGQAET
jgi:hypothetical protein